MKSLLAIILTIAPGLTLAAYFKTPVDETALENVLSAHIKTLNRPISTFHWEEKKSSFSSKFDLSTKAGEREYLDAHMGGYLDTMGINGFYVATDPAMSKRFRGWGDDWRLIQVDLPVNFTYLDIRDRKLDRELAAIVGMECANRFTEGGRKMGRAVNECDLLKQKILRKIGVNGIRYGWESPSLPSGSGCPGSDTSAFTVLNSNWLKPEMYKTFTSGSRDNHEERALIQDMVRNTPRFFIFSGDILWPDLPAAPGISQATKNWMQNHLLNCQDESTGQRRTGVEVSPPEVGTGSGETDAQ